jgi:D-alanine-D-alanine ligase
MIVAVVMGGYSDEAVISLKSGQLILQNLDRSRYTPVEVHILKEGWAAVVHGKRYPIDRGDFSFTGPDGKVKFDVILNTIHGTPGEDGHMQAYWALLGIPFGGCNFYQSALTFNKRDTLSVLSKFGIPHAKSIYLTQGEPIDAEMIKNAVGLPFFVKPNQSGSSLGISKVHDLSELDAALELAFKEDRDILIESFLDGMEVSVGVLKYNGETRVLGVTEIVPHNEFFDYEAKYEGKSDEITPARIESGLMDLVCKTAARVYDVLDMTGFSRAEYIIVNGTPYFLEINTNPGLSPASILPQQAAHAGIPMSDLFESEIRLALNRKTLLNR